MQRSTLRFLSVLIGLAATATAQTTFTTPRGFDTVEGGTNHAYILGNRVSLTWQEIDSTQRGLTSVSKSIAWRRDATTATSTDFVARDIEMEIYLANSELTTITTTHTLNYIGTPTNVVKKKTVKAPDWQKVPTTTPAPFDFKVPFDTAWVYQGKHDFLWEVRVTKNSYTGTAFTNYPFDFHYVVPGGSLTTAATTSTSTVNGAGCTVTGQSAPFALSSSIMNYRSKYRLAQSVANAPANTLVQSYFDITDPNVAISGWCAKVRTGATFPIPLGTTNSTGAATSTLDLPYVAYAVGATLYAQSVAWDTGTSNITLSNGIKYQVPADPSRPRVGRVYSYLSGTAITSSGPWTGGIIAQFGL